MYAPTKQQNLKGDIFQLNHVNFDRNGNYLPSKKSDDLTEVTLNDLGKIVKEKSSLGYATYYDYDSKGNLVRERTFNAVRTYTYDNVGRVIQEVFVNNEKETSKSQYSYTKQKDLLVVKETGTALSKKPYQSESHFKNGLMVYTKTAGELAKIIQYEFDHKGNWIKRTTVNAETKKELVEPYNRAFIYYDEYDKGPSDMSVVTTRLSKDISLLVPKLYINNKIYNTNYCRFIDDYVFYDAFSKTYYVARGGYSKSNIEGQKFTVEKLSTGAETVLLYDGKYLDVADNGIAPKSKNQYNFKTYYGNYVARDSIAGKAFYFGVLPTMAIQKTIMLPGTNMKDPNTSVWYLFNAEKKTILVFDRGEIVKIAAAGFTGPENNPVLAESNIRRYVLLGFKNMKDKTFTQGRYFDPKTDKIKSN